MTLDRLQAPPFDQSAGLHAIQLHQPMVSMCHQYVQMQSLTGQACRPQHALHGHKQRRLLCAKGATADPVFLAVQS